MGLIESLASLLQDKGTIPNKLTLAMGEHIHQARREAGLSAVELAERAAYLTERQIKSIESGEKEVTASEIAFLAAALDKPISYFYPEWVVQRLEPNYMTVEELELLMLVRKLEPAQYQTLIKQVRSMTAD